MVQEHEGLQQSQYRLVTAVEGPNMSDDAASRCAGKRIRREKMVVMVLYLDLGRFAIAKNSIFKKREV
jgi:hypothetical protein